MRHQKAMSARVGVRVPGILFVSSIVEAWLLFAGAPVPAAGGEDNTWKPTSTGGAPFARGYQAAVWTGSKMIVWGGSYGRGTTNTGGIYDPATDTWTPTTTVGAPTARCYHTAVWTGSKMIVWGGAGDRAALTDRTPAGSTTRPPTPGARRAPSGLPRPASYHTAVWTGSKMIVWGGWTGSADPNTGGIYDPATDTWTATSTVGAPTARAGHTAVWTGSKMIVWGGRRPGSEHRRELRPGHRHLDRR